jgi:hypothetical protein
MCVVFYKLLHVSLNFFSLRRRADPSSPRRSSPTALCWTLSASKNRGRISTICWAGVTRSRVFRGVRQGATRGRRRSLVLKAHQPAQVNFYGSPPGVRVDLDDGSVTTYLFLGRSKHSQIFVARLRRVSVEKFGYTKHRDASRSNTTHPEMGTNTTGGASSGDTPGITICVFGPGPRQNMGFLLSFKSVSVYAQDRRAS